MEPSRTVNCLSIAYNILFCINWIYVFASKKIAAGAGVEMERDEQRRSARRSESMMGMIENMSEGAALRKVAEKRTVK